jgi:hypothetical protein
MTTSIFAYRSAYSAKVAELQSIFRVTVDRFGVDIVDDLMSDNRFAWIGRKGGSKRTLKPTRASDQKHRKLLRNFAFQNSHAANMDIYRQKLRKIAIAINAYQDLEHEFMFPALDANGVRIVSKRKMGKSMRGLRLSIARRLKNILSA